MSVKLWIEHNLGFLSLKGKCTGLSESTQSCQDATLLEITCHSLFVSALEILVPTAYGSSEAPTSLHRLWYQRLYYLHTQRAEADEG